MNKSIDGSKTCCTFLREAFAFLRERINYYTVVSELWSKMKLLVKISWLYMPVCTDRTGALLQIGSSSRDSVPVPFHLLPGKCSLTPDECLLFMHQTTLSVTSVITYAWCCENTRKVCRSRAGGNSFKKLFECVPWTETL